MMIFGTRFLILCHIMLDICSSKTVRHKFTIMHSANFRGKFGRTRVQGSKALVCDIAKLKHKLTNCTAANDCFFVYQGNSLTRNDSQSQTLAIDVLKNLHPSVVALGVTEYKMGADVIKRFNDEFNVPQSNVRRTKSDSIKLTEVSGINFLSYVNSVVKRSPGATSATVLNILDFLELVEDTLSGKFVVLVGCLSLKEARKIARKSHVINVILSGCSPELLWHTNSPPENMITHGIYPEVYRTSDGTPILIAHVSGGTKFMGKLSLVRQGNKLHQYSGEMLYMDEDTPEDPEMLKIVKDYYLRRRVTNRTTRPVEVVAKAGVFLSGLCWKSECNLGNLITDAFVQYKADIYTGKYWTDTPIAILASGCIKHDIAAFIHKRPITVDDLTVVDDDNLVTVEIKGAVIRGALEHGMQYVTRKSGHQAFLQVSGLRLIYDRRRRWGHKLLTTKVRCDRCAVPAYSNLQRPDRYYLVTTEKLANGAYGHTLLKNEGIIVHVENITARKALYIYMKHLKTLYASNHDRIVQQAKLSAPNPLKGMHIINLGMFILCTIIV